MPRKTSYKNQFRVDYRDDLLKKYSRAAGERSHVKKVEAMVVGDESSHGAQEVRVDSFEDGRRVC